MYLKSVSLSSVYLSNISLSSVYSSNISLSSVYLSNISLSNEQCLPALRHCGVIVTCCPGQALLLCKREMIYREAGVAIKQVLLEQFTRYCILVKIN